MTQRVEYRTSEGRLVAIAIQYRRPDGTLGGSGRSDPKLLLEGNEGLIPSHGDDDSCPDCPTWGPRARASR